MHEIKEIEERLILVGVQEDDSYDVEESLDELEELAETAGAEAVGRLVQKREKIHPVTYIGKGKDLVWETDATGVACDDELSPVQLKNLEQELDCKVIDRTLLILDIFAARARSSEGKIQVELAQLKYRAAHLVGVNQSLSRLGGGIGTRGPGEKKLEIDRRRIRERISQLKRELSEIRQHRELIREKRKKKNIKIAALVGYSSAGKSSILNLLTEADVLVDAKLFSTLDTTTRALKLPGGQTVYLTDTVGFIRKLPHHLIEAFKSTLEEVTYADIIVHVVDASHPQMEVKMQTVYDTLRQLGVEDQPVITLFNKMDKLPDAGRMRDFRADETIRTSAKTGQGMEEFQYALEELLRKDQIYIERLYPYEKGGLIQLIRQEGELLSEEYKAEGIAVKAYVPRSIYGKL